PPGLQGGTYAIRLTASSESNPNLIVQTEVMVTVNPTRRGVTLSVAPDPLFTVPFNGAELPTAFVATLHNQRPAPHTLNFTSPAGPPPGSTGATGGPPAPPPPGETATIGIYLFPAAQVPAPGTQESFTVTATTTDSKVTQTQAVNFPTPAIDAVTIASSPTSV